MISSALPTVYVKDIVAAVRFYTEILGCKLQFQSGPYWAQVDAGRGTSIGLHPPSAKAPAPGTHGSISIGFYVNGSIDDTVETLKAKGVRFHGPIVADPPVRLAFFSDPDGNDLYLCEYKPESA